MRTTEHNLPYVVSNQMLSCRDHQTSVRVLFVAGHALVSSSEADLCPLGIEMCTDARLTVVSCCSCYTEASVLIGQRMKSKYPVGRDSS